MADLRAAAQQALEWAESHGEAMFAGGGSQAVEHMNAWTQALRAALAQEEQPADAEAALRLALAQRDWAFKQLMAQEEQEPVAHCNYPHCQSAAGCVGACAKANRPPRREWQGLTLLERSQIMADLMADGDVGIDRLICAFEDALRRKNHE